MGKTGWISDTCPCKLLLQNNAGTMELYKWIVKCHIHKDELDANLFNAVFVQNHLFDAELEEDQPVLKQAEYIRVKALGALTISTDPEVQMFV